MKTEHIIDLTILALTLLLVALIPLRVMEYRDANFKADVERPFRDHGVKL